MHALPSGQSVPSKIILNPTDPVEVVSLEFYTASIDNGNPGTPVTTVFLGIDVWVRATVRDPFGRDDINESSTTLTVTEPGQSPSAATLVLPSQTADVPG